MTQEQLQKSKGVITEEKLLNSLKKMPKQDFTKHFRLTKIEYFSKTSSYQIN